MKCPHCGGYLIKTNTEGEELPPSEGSIEVGEDEKDKQKAVEEVPSHPLFDLSVWYSHP